jgi:hypothetical protein
MLVEQARRRTPRSIETDSCARAASSGSHAMRSHMLTLSIAMNIPAEQEMNKLARVGVNARAIYSRRS